jgi:hypothetical protein
MIGHVLRQEEDMYQLFTLTTSGIFAFFSSSI